jgi:hypothetical protein
MIVGVDQGRHSQQAAAACFGLLDRDDAIIVNPDDMGTACRRSGVRLDMSARQFPHRPGSASACPQPNDCGRARLSSIGRHHRHAFGRWQDIAAEHLGAL